VVLREQAGRRVSTARIQASQRTRGRLGGDLKKSLAKSGNIDKVSDVNETKKIQKIETEIAGIKNELMNLGSIHPGSLSRQYNVCGKAGCKCKDPQKPQRHGPYYKVSYAYGGKFSSRFIPRDKVKEVEVELKNYKRLRKLTEDWIGLSIQLVKEKRKLEG
jgi:hypothetical protein